MKHSFSYFPAWRTQQKALRSVSMATASLTPLASPPSKEMSLAVSAVETWQTLQMGSWMVLTRMHLQAREDGGSLAPKKINRSLDESLSNGMAFFFGFGCFRFSTHKFHGLDTMEALKCGICMRCLGRRVSASDWCRIGWRCHWEEMMPLKELLSAHDFAEIWLPSPPVNEVSNCLSLSHDFVHFLHFPTCCRLFGWFWWKLKNGWVMIQWFMWINEHSLQKWAMAPLKEGLWMALAKGQIAPCQHCHWWIAHPVVECL